MSNPRWQADGHEDDAVFVSARRRPPGAAGRELRPACPGSLASRRFSFQHTPAVQARSARRKNSLKHAKERLIFPNRRAWPGFAPRPACGTTGKKKKRQNFRRRVSSLDSVEVNYDGVFNQ